MSNDKVVNVAFTLDELNLVLSALAELPAKVSMNLIGKVTAQAQQQLQAPAEEVNNG
jgi:hypothetical protein